MPLPLLFSVLLVYASYYLSDASSLLCDALLFYASYLRIFDAYSLICFFSSLMPSPDCVILLLPNAAGALKNPHLGIEEQTGVHVAPVAIEDVTGDDKEIDPSADGQVDEIDQRLTGGTTQLSNRCTRVALEPVERTVDMHDVGR